MEVLAEEAFAYLKYSWMKEPEFSSIRESDILHSLEAYDEFMGSLVPDDTPFARYIHRERMLYDLHDQDELLVFRFDPRDESESDSDTNTCYSESEYDDSSSEALSFINNVRIMDEGDFRDQIMANEFTGGYWDPAIHWVLSKARLRLIVRQ